MLDLSLREIVIVIPVILIALTVHELSHAVVAFALGDDTAKRAGRVTLNPLKHIDPVGFLMLVIVGFGWAKPVRIERKKLRKPVRDEILVAFAGPLSNLLLAFLGTVTLRVIVTYAPDLVSSSSSGTVWYVVASFCTINIALAIFNSLPIPPLDGSHLLTSFLVEKHERAAAMFTKYGFLLLISIIIIGRVTDHDIIPIGRAIVTIFDLMIRLVGLG